MGEIEIVINHYGKGDEIPRTQSIVVLPASLLRDLFAVALSLSANGMPGDYNYEQPAVLAKKAYDLADALMAERAKREGT